MVPTNSVPKSSSFIVLSLILGGVSLGGLIPDANAMGKKRAREEAAAQAELERQAQAKAEQEQRETERQIRIERQVRRIERQLTFLEDLRGRLGIEAAVDAELPETLASLDETELHAIEDRLQQEIDSLEARLFSRVEDYEAKEAERDRITQVALERAKSLMAQLGREGVLGANPTHWVEQRCNGLFDSLPSQVEQARGRAKWSSYCLDRRINQLKIEQAEHELASGLPDPELLFEINLATLSYSVVNGEGAKPYTAGRWWYPSFGKIQGTELTNPKRLVAPTSETDDCETAYSVDAAGANKKKTQVDLLDEYHLAAMCVTGCYTPDQKLRFDGGYLQIGEAFARGAAAIRSLSKDSTLEHPVFETNWIEAYTVDVADALQEVIDITTQSGKRLSVTRNHPVLDASGQMRRAETFVLGEPLVLTDGTLDPIVETTGRSYYGKVYNVRIAGSDPLHQIIDSEGILTGSVHFQNEGVKDLNRQLFRAQIPAALY